MGDKLAFRYDREADILTIEKCLPYAEQESEESSPEVVARSNARTGEIEVLEVLFFSIRMQQVGSFDLPITANLRRAP